MKRRRPVVAGPEETAQAAAARMTEEACGSVLVCDGDRLRGIFTERDLMTRVVGRGLDPRTTRLEQVMTRDPDRIEGTATAREALRRMDEFGYRHLPVMKAAACWAWSRCATCRSTPWPRCCRSWSGAACSPSGCGDVLRRGHAGGRARRGS